MDIEEKEVKADIQEDDISPDGKVRLQKIIADRGFCSRRKAEELIVAEKVKVNGEIINTLGMSFDPNCKIEIDGYELKKPGQKVYLAVNKPLGFICTADDPQHRKLVTQLVPPQYGRVVPVGRLDINSEGLIILTNDGEFVNLVTHPSSSPDKVYEVKIDGRLTREDREKIQKGILLDDGYTAPAVIKEMMTSIYGCLYQITIHEGKNREIRRMMEYFNKKVISLKRIAVGPIKLKDMPRGAYREIPLKIINEMLVDCREKKRMYELKKKMEEARQKKATV